MTEREICERIVKHQWCVAGDDTRIGCQGECGLNKGTPCPCFEGEFSCERDGVSAVEAAQEWLNAHPEVVCEVCEGEKPLVDLDSSVEGVYHMGIRDTSLIIRTSADGGHLDFGDVIEIAYCPVCGRKLGGQHD